MKTLLWSLAAALTTALTGNAQLTLTGTSYTQNFDGIGGGLPLGWGVFTSATASEFGTPSLTFQSAQTVWNSTNDAYRNISSSNIALASTSVQQDANTDRAFGWRPVGENSAAVTPFRTGAVMLTIANTFNLVDFSMSFSVFQTNNTTGVQTYKLEYRIGGSGNFTQLGTDYVTKDASADFTNFNTQSFSITSASLLPLNNQNQEVYIRLRGVSTAGSGNLDTIGIDNFSLTYAAIPEPSTYALILGVGALGFAAYRRRQRGATV